MMTSAAAYGRELMTYFCVSFNDAVDPKTRCYGVIMTRLKVQD